MPRYVDFDPFAEPPVEETPAPEPAPAAKPGLLSRIGDAFTGASRTEYPDAQEFRSAYEGSLPPSAVPAMQAQSLGREPSNADFSDQQAASEFLQGRQALGTSSFTPDPKAQLDILRKAIPGLEDKTDKFGNIMLKTPNMKDWAYLNRPGASARDAEEVMTQTMATAPVLGWMSGAGSTLGLMGRGLVGGVAASVGQDAAATAAGSEQGVDAGRAAISGGINAAIPAAARVGSAVVGGAAAATDAVGDFVRTAVAPRAQARREVQGAFATDARTGGLNPIGPADRAAAQNRGQDLRTMDFGGETVSALARKSANISPAARDMLMRVITPRSGKMAKGRRGEALVEQEFGLARSSELARQDLQQQARNARQPLYTQSYRMGAGGYNTPILQQMQNSPIFGRAMQRAERTMQDRAATPGWQTTGLRGPNGHTLEFWDMTKQALDDYATTAFRRGENNRGALIAQMARDLRNELDTQVPLYRQARGTAQTFFGADDALQAGGQFARGGRYNLDDARRAFQALNPAERNLFQEGFADELVQRMRQNPNYLNQIRDIPAEWDRVNLALGQQRFNELEGFLRIEQIMQRMRDAMGNSTTARQLQELQQNFGGGLWNTIGGGSFGAGLANFSPSAMLVGALLMGGKRAHGAVNRRVAEEVAQLLTSTDPDVFLRGIQQAGQTRILDAIRAFDHMLTDAGIPQVRPFAVQAGINANSYQPEAAR